MNFIDNSDVIKLLLAFGFFEMIIHIEITKGGRGTMPVGTGLF